MHKSLRPILFATIVSALLTSLFASSSFVYLTAGMYSLSYSLSIFILLTLAIGVSSIITYSIIFILLQLVIAKTQVVNVKPFCIIFGFCGAAVSMFFILDGDEISDLLSLTIYSLGGTLGGWVFYREA